MQKREYQSKYTEDGKCTEAQYLVDISLERIAKREKETLTKSYWRNPKWVKNFRRQIVAANALLKEFTCKQIVDALNSPRGKNIYSLGLKKPISEIIEDKKGKEVQRIKFKDPETQAKYESDWDDDEDVFTASGIGSISKLEKQQKSVWEELNGTS